MLLQKFDPLTEKTREDKKVEDELACGGYHGPEGSTNALKGNPIFNKWRKIDERKAQTKKIENEIKTENKLLKIASN